MIQALRDAAARLAGVSETPRLDAELLLAHALGVTRDRLLLDPPQGTAPENFEALVARRLTGEPIAYILGRRDFWTIDLDVGPGVLVPRADSETLLEGALDHFAARSPARILDLGTGPGTLLLAALDQWKDARGVGVDRSPQALAYARRNAVRLGLRDRVEWREGGWDAASDARFDLILCNPPYVEEGAGDLGPGVAEHEPHEALFAGPDGLDDYRALAPLFAPMLEEGGLVALEIGHTQADAVAQLMAAEGLSAVVRRDLAGRPRALLLTRSG